MIDLRRFFPAIWPTDGELAEDEWEREPGFQETGVLGVYEAAPRPRWTADEPRRSGLYFVRAGPGDPTRVVDVYHDPVRGWSCEWSDITPRPIRGSGLQFSDRPIQEPLP